MTGLLRQAFKALDAGSSKHETALVADALVASEDEPTLEALDAAAGSREAFADLVDEVVELGGTHFEVLDLVTAVSMRRTTGERLALVNSPRTPS